MNMANDIAVMPKAVAEAMNSKKKDSAINKCIPDNKALIQTWADGCGYDPKATGKMFGKTLEQMMEAYIDGVCVPFTILGACSNVVTA